MSSKLPISVVVIAKDEEAHIERCLKSVPFAQELLVVDSFSSDRTVEFAQKCGAKVLQEKWRGFGPQKAFAAQQASCDWILSLDADEALSPELAQEIQQKFASLDPKAGYRLPRLSFHLGRWIRHGGWYPDYQMRLFNKKHANWNAEVVHEKVQVERTETLQNNLLHWVFEGVSDQAVTNDRYSTLGAEQFHRQGKKFSLLKLIFKPASKFFETYIFKAGFLDGLPGFIISVGAAYSAFLRWAKMWEMEQKSRKNK